MMDLRALSKTSESVVNCSPVELFEPRVQASSVYNYDSCVTGRGRGEGFANPMMGSKKGFRGDNSVQIQQPPPN
jgi:hypothetical protein